MPVAAKKGLQIHIKTRHVLYAGAGLPRQTSEILLPPPTNPALMTLTSDGVVRIWIEVVLSPTFGPDISILAKPRSPGGSPRGSPKKGQKTASPLPQGQASIPSEANLCVGLVIQPPVADAAVNQPSSGGWRACWGVPQKSPGFAQVSYMQLPRNSTKSKWQSCLVLPGSIRILRCIQSIHASFMQDLACLPWASPQAL